MGKHSGLRQAMAGSRKAWPRQRWKPGSMRSRYSSERTCSHRRTGVSSSALLPLETPLAMASALRANWPGSWNKRRCGPTATRSWRNCFRILGRPEEATTSIERAIQRVPTAAELWRSLLEIQLRRREYPALKQIVERATASSVESPHFDFYLAVHEAELSDELHPDILFAKAAPDLAHALDAWRVRHLLRLGAVDAALPIINEGLKGPAAHVLWPYAATAWRLAGNRQLEWLEGNPAFVRTFDLTKGLPPLDQLASALRALHLAKGEFPDQSVRGGTQTDGPLFSRIEPIIQQLRAAIVGAVEVYRSDLPPADPRHPLLSHRRDRRVRFSGSWSVRLHQGGRHSNHVHPQGWISSALYISLPPKRPNEAEDAGWLTLGEPDAQMQLDLPPTRKIEPMAGHLVLFPSWMWHGTVPFSTGERLTVAFDVRPPI